jgi:WD repeat-containing protein 68
MLCRIDQVSQFRLAIGSYVERYSNAIQIVYKDQHGGGGYGGGVTGADGDSSSAEDPQMYEACKIDHPYPCTKVLWTPDRSHGTKDLLATTGDYLRIWSLSHEVDMASSEPGAANRGQQGQQQPGGGEPMMKLRHKKEALLDNNKNSEYCAPLTSFDWNETDPHILGTSSIDTTCTIWDINTQTAKTQLIAHDKEVFDIAFARGPNVFASVGADGSVRMFDLRSLEHSTIIYESPKFAPLLRLAWNKQDSNYLATFAVDASSTTILDMRVPSVPVAQLGGHTGHVNAMAWAPHTSCHLCTTGEDRQALIWDLSSVATKPVEDPTLQFAAEGEINNLQWSAVQPDWISIAYNDQLQIRKCRVM